MEQHRRREAARFVLTLAAELAVFLTLFAGFMAVVIVAGAS
jgi:hypothetical protein